MISKEAKRKLLKKKNVVAVGRGFKYVSGKKTGLQAVAVSVSRKMPESFLDKRDIVPLEIEGEWTDVVEVGNIKALEIDPKLKHRPCPSGVSIGHPIITAGTLGCYLTDGKKYYALSNNHVLAASNEAQIDDAIIQPGSYDGGSVGVDTLGFLKDFEPVKMVGIPADCNIAKWSSNIVNFFAKMLNSSVRMIPIVEVQSEGENVMDAAIAVVAQEAVDLAIPQIGLLVGSGVCGLGEKIKKFGRTTLYTEGEVEQVDVTVNVQYGEGKFAMFSDQIMAGPMSAGGDSGSIVVNDSNKAVGLLFAGSDAVTIFSPIEYVLERFDMSIATGF